MKPVRYVRVNLGTYLCYKRGGIALGLYGWPMGWL